MFGIHSCNVETEVYDFQRKGCGRREQLYKDGATTCTPGKVKRLVSGTNKSDLILRPPN